MTTTLVLGRASGRSNLLAVYLPGRGHNHRHGERAGEEGLRGVQGQGQELSGRGRGGGQGQRHRAAGQAQGAARGLRRQEHQEPYSALL